MLLLNTIPIGEVNSKKIRQATSECLSLSNWSITKWAQYKYT